MIIIPELKTVLICTPKTGTTSLMSAIEKKYSKSKILHRHMEADGLPKKYLDYKKIGVFRDPVERLWSLYNYSATFDTLDKVRWKDHIRNMRESVKDLDFNEWILSNKYPLTQPLDSYGERSEKYSVKHIRPENMKSQYIYLRPDLGTEIIHYDELYKLEEKLSLSLEKLNKTEKGNLPTLNEEVKNHINKFLKWDLDFQLAHEKKQKINLEKKEHSVILKSQKQRKI